MNLEAITDCRSCETSITQQTRRASGRRASADVIMENFMMSKQGIAEHSNQKSYPLDGVFLIMRVFVLAKHGFLATL